MNQQQQNLWFWRLLSNFWGTVAGLAFIVTFFDVLNLRHLLADITIIYVSLLSIYTGLKEIKRWKDKKFMSQYHGEIFVLLWTILMSVFIALSAIDTQKYRLSNEFTATYLSVIGLFAISRKSKNMHKK